MSNSVLKKYLLLFLTFFIAAFLLISNSPKPNVHKAYAASPIQHVFIIMEENHDWSDIKGSAAPYINNTLLPMGGHAEQYYNPPGIHPSAPNYVWLEAGSAATGQNDCSPSSSSCRTSVNHLSKLIDAAGLTWREYAEDASGTSCILGGAVDVNHVPFSYFNDVTNNGSSSFPYCISHERPFTQLATDLTGNSVANYNFITPNLNDDMHNGTIQQADSWLSTEVPKILNSQAYKSNGVLFIIWDEGEPDDGPIGMIVESPLAKKNYSNTIHYDHSSTLKTLEEIFGVSPMLGGAASATDLSDFFTVPLTGTGVTNPPAPTNITPTLFCLGSCPVNPTPTIGTGNNPTSIPGNGTPVTTTAPSNAPPCIASVKNASVHAFKAHRHSMGAISNLLLLFLQFLLQLLQQLFGGGTITNPPGNPTPTTTINPSAAPTINPCPSTSPSIVNPTLSPTP
jgi:phosphatidylinositol-3-phosphatase